MSTADMSTADERLADARPGRDGDLTLAEHLSRLARSLQEHPDTEATLTAIVHAAVGTVPGAQEASISSIRRRRDVRTLAATSEAPAGLDQAQYDTDEGPCLDALYAQTTVHVPDMATEHRWPEFSRRARDLGAGSMLAVQLFVAGDDLGALNLSSREPHAFDDQSEHVALLFAAHAAVAMADAQEQDRLSTALSTRDLIGQAKGVLIERFKITGDQAFALLVHVSQRTNRKLHDISEELVTTGRMPDR